MRYAGYIIALLLILTGCSDRLETDLTVAGLETSVRLDISVKPMQSTAPSTKAGYIDPSTQESTQIRDLWVLQFDGTDGSAKMLKAWYYPDYTPSTDIRLLTSTSANTILLVANTGDKTAELGRCRTLADAVNVGKTVIDDTSANGGWTSGWNIIMNGKTTATITDGMAPISVSLVRNAVRVDVTVNNQTGSTANPVTVNSVSICTGVQKLYYYTDYTLPDIYPTEQDVEPYIYPATDWTDGTGTSDSRKFTFYVPANKRGTVTNAVPADKPRMAPSNSTYLLILGRDSESREVAYRFYLGADLVQDFNLLPGYRYSYTINLTSAGDCRTDARVENLHMQDFTATPLANAYMVQPPLLEGVWKSVRVPVRRVHDFWNITDGYEKVNNNALEPGCFGWQMEIIRSTVELVEDVNFKWIKRTGTDYTDYFEFAIPAGLAGNFVLGVHRFTDAGQTLLDDVFLWSWHFWVTDYNPDATLSLLTPESDASGYEARYAYDVVGGQVHRYRGDIWKSPNGALKDEFMMDRNLGATSVTEHHGPGSLYYQYGRKDPFPYSSKNWNAVANGVIIYNRYNDEKWIPYRTNAQLEEAGVTDDYVRYSVYHPEMHITIAGSWSKSDADSEGRIYNNATNWYDTKLDADYLTSKSIFDPCPPGWRLPPDNCMGTPSGTVSSTVNMVLSKTLPNGAVIYYPCQGSYFNGIWSSSVQFYTDIKDFSGLWANRRYTAANGYRSSGGSYDKCRALSVRCVSYTEP